MTKNYIIIEIEYEMKKDKYSKHTMEASTNLVATIPQQYSLKGPYGRLNYLPVVAIHFLNLYLQI